MTVDRHVSMVMTRMGGGNALSVLTDFSATYNEPFDGISVTTIDGTTNTR